MKNETNQKLRRQQKFYKRLIVILSVFFFVALINLFYSIYQTRDHFFKEEPGVKIAKTKTDTESEEKSFSFVGVGDNLIHGAIWYYPNYELDENGNTDYSSIYTNTNPYTQNADLAYINAETITMGTNESEYSSYPVFNGPIELFQALKNSGFDWLSISSNHSLDTSVQGLIEENEYIKQNYPDFTVTGSYASKEDSEKPIVREVNGIKVGFQGYTYGTNGIPLDPEYSWALNVYRNDDGTVNYEMIKNDLDELKKASDIQIVAMHWGDEYQTAANDEQKELAEFLNQQGVEIIIGTHPHVIEPAEIIHGENQDTLVYYSLGNFLSAQDVNERMIGGMARFNVTYNPNTKKTTFSDVQFVPTVTWFPSGFSSFRTYALPEYTDDLAANHFITTHEGQDITKEWVQNYVKSVMGEPEGIEIVYS